MTASKRIVGPFTNEHGTFNPGDPCVAITVCTGRVNVERVEYVGYVERRDYDWNSKASVLTKYAQVRRINSKFTAFYKGTGEVAKWPYTPEDVEYRYVDKPIITTLQENRILPAQITTDQLIKEI